MALSTNAGAIKFNVNGAERMRISSDGIVKISGAINLNGDNLQFPSTGNQYKINLWGVNNYGFGIGNGTLMYSSQLYHKFYNSSNNANTFTIDSTGNISCTGSAAIANGINITGATNAPQSLSFRSTDYNLGIAGAAGHYSSSVVAGDMILRTLAGTRLTLQTGSGSYGLMIDSSNSVSIKNLLSVVGSLTVGGTGYISGNTTIAGDTETNAIKTTGSYAYASLGDVFIRTGYNGGGDYNSSMQNAYVSARFNYGIFVQSNIYNASDSRIKKDINDIVDDTALQQILLIQPKTYKYIDEIGRGSDVVYGFIAQQVKEVLPQAVSEMKEIIPNIYKKAICSGNIITLENDISNELNIDDNIQIYIENGNSEMHKIININSNVIEIEKEINKENVFIYGKEIKDFNSLKKDYIFTLNVCATQELYKLITQQNIIIQDLQNRISILENNI